MSHQPIKQSGRSEEATASILSAWRKFDEASAEAQALLLGEAIMQSPSLLRDRLLRRLGPEFGNTRSDLLAVGSQFLDYKISKLDKGFEQVRSIVNGMQNAIDRIEESDRERLKNGGEQKRAGLSPDIFELNLVPPEAWHEFFKIMMRSQLDTRNNPVILAA